MTDLRKAARLAGSCQPIILKSSTSAELFLIRLFSEYTFNMKKKKIPQKILAAAAVTVLLAAAACYFYISDYYHASGEARAALADSKTVQVRPIPGGLLFDGPGEENALIFYPGGKVEYTAYAPLLHGLAETGTDAFLLKMPGNLAILGIGRADDVMADFDYPHWYIGGHSLGGAAAAMFAADHDLDGLVLLAAYPDRAVDERSLELYGTNDGVLNREKRDAGDRYLPADSEVVEIEGANHAYFGNYGEQKKDGTAAISREEQQSIAIRRIAEFIDEETAGKDGR